MSQNKKVLRARFNEACLERDGHQCRACKANGRVTRDSLAVHHIVDRHEMPNGGYVPENGISLCEPCHRKAEVWHESGKARSVPGMSPDDLYAMIGSSREKALKASEGLSG